MSPMTQTLTFALYYVATAIPVTKTFTISLSPDTTNIYTVPTTATLVTQTLTLSLEITATPSLSTQQQSGSYR